MVLVVVSFNSNSTSKRSWTFLGAIYKIFSNRRADYEIFYYWHEFSIGNIFVPCPWIFLITFASPPSPREVQARLLPFSMHLLSSGAFFPPLIKITNTNISSWSVAAVLHIVKLWVARHHSLPHWEKIFFFKIVFNKQPRNNEKRRVCIVQPRWRLS